MIRKEDFKDKVNSLIIEASGYTATFDYIELDRIRRQALVVSIYLYGESDDISTELKSLDLLDNSYLDDHEMKIAMGRVNNLLKHLKFKIELGILPKDVNNEGKNYDTDDNKNLCHASIESNLGEIEIKDNLRRIFIVHGHDEEMKEAVARATSKLNLEPIILHEQPNKGRTIIEKFENYSDVGFAIVLLSPDDFAYPKGVVPNEGKFRARQNVVLELGYFLAKLGRNRVVALYRNNDNFELPSDYLGVLYIPYDKENWKYKLADELKAIDPNIDKNKL